VTMPDSTLVMNMDSLPICEKMLKKDGIMLINSTLVKENPARSDIKVVKIEASGIAEQVGNVLFANMVALGAMAKLTNALKLADIEGILRKFFPADKHQFIPMNLKAIKSGYDAI
ncbi:MAG: 2-oxoacid:acceptor oxidoreductase family protein, partial [Treponema sp.]|nr:2-oxoacid:acceptor oxidoreductase family protein [Treponema sp.]